MRARPVQGKPAGPHLPDQEVAARPPARLRAPRRPPQALPRTRAAGLTVLAPGPRPPARARAPPSARGRGAPGREPTRGESRSPTAAGRSAAVSGLSAATPRRKPSQVLRRMEPQGLYDNGNQKIDWQTASTSKTCSSSLFFSRTSIPF
ncbi:translation initiation factor IF-2-like [Onychomys torridus]|uniref:translation initiation factor IF-2-like n=1 Tax=Onychomys torridus TaxID=38674 RepID=UPI00167F6197|nr:translation initiation factor IF-2-like [Onychomys torridus]